MTLAEKQATIFLIWFGLAMIAPIIESLIDSWNNE